MVQATNTNITTRRSFLSRIGLTTAAVTVGIAPVVLASPVDPAFAAVDRHRAAMVFCQKTGEELDRCFALIADELKCSPRVGINVDRPSLEKCVSHYVCTRELLEKEIDQLAKIYTSRRDAARLRKWATAKRAEWDYQVHLIKVANETSGYSAASKAYDEASAEREVADAELMAIKVTTIAGLTAWGTYLGQLMEAGDYHDPRVVAKMIGHLSELTS